jgi:hypothetical protein
VQHVEIDHLNSVRAGFMVHISEILFYVLLLLNALGATGASVDATGAAADVRLLFTAGGPRDADAEIDSVVPATATVDDATVDADVGESDN